VADARVDDQDQRSQLPVPGTAPLASRADRLAAVTVDSVVGLAVAIPLGFWTGAFQAAIQGEPISWFVYLENFLAGWGWYFLVNSYLLRKYGQTVGKRLLGIRIAEHHSEAVPPFARLVLRTVVSTLPDLLGIIGELFSLADTLFIFSKDRRCIHDWIARTRVVKMQGPP
jgi:uncharacterized RDD family membrane protein YckC